jgi:hypothetical protein
MCARIAFDDIEFAVSGPERLEKRTESRGECTVLTVRKVASTKQQAGNPFQCELPQSIILMTGAPHTS